MLRIEEQVSPSGPALLQRGFRPFFLGAMCQAVLALALWAGVYLVDWGLPGIGAYDAAAYWHGREMVFGYALAVVAGFLLTAVQNWTGQVTLRDLPLAGLFALWAGARLCAFVGAHPASTVLDLLFELWLAWALAVPLWRAGQWANLGILIPKLILLAVAQAAFALGVLGLWAAGQRLGLFGGFYLILSLVFVMARRVMPFFIERAAAGGCTLRNRPWVDRVSLYGFLGFALLDLAWPDSAAVGVLALALALLHVLRLAGWYHPVIWRRPLLWVLYSAYAWLVAGFLLKAAASWAGVSPFLAVHAFAYGGIGLMSAGMMARVALGHTGRDVHAPPRVLRPVFALLLGGAVVRVLLPLIFPAHYATLIGLSAALWLAAFMLLLGTYAPILLGPRVDGRPG